MSKIVNLTTGHPKPHTDVYWHTENTMTLVQPGPTVEVAFYAKGVNSYVKLTPKEAAELGENLTAASAKAAGKDTH